MRHRTFGTIVLAAAVIFVTGCDGFFVDPHGTTGTGGDASGDYLYAANAQTNALTGYGIGKNTLTKVATAYALPAGFTSTSVAVSRANTFVYVGGALGIVGYSIGIGGVLTALNGGSPLVTASVASLDTSPDGQWLFGLDQTTLTVDEYKINTSTGGLAVQASGVYGLPTPATVVVPRQVICSPKGNYVVAVLGTGGFAVFSFNTSTGVLSPLPKQPNFGSVATLSFNGGAIEPTDTYLYVSQSGSVGGASANGVYGYNLANVASGSTTAPVAALVPTGGSPGPVALNLAGNYLYVGNRTDQTISGYTVTDGTATPLSGSPYTFSPALTASALLAEKTGTYLLQGTQGNVSDVSMFSYDATTAGKLNLQVTSTTGNDLLGPALAVTH